MTTTATHLLCTIGGYVHEHVTCNVCGEVIPDADPRDTEPGSAICRDCGFTAMQAKHGSDWYIER